VLRGEKQLKFRKFEYYLRQCEDCGNLFKAKSKRSCYCEPCKKERTHIKITNSLKSRGFIWIFKKIENDINELDSKPK
jgi:Zn finger protein HypA/HybF involved in hydrogenase expression